MQKTFGPVVIQSEVNKDAFVAKCLHQGYYCIFAVGGTCTHNRDREDRAIPPDSTTPDWCEMKESALEDAMIMAVENGDL
tara:strand:+ start:197 stop:436 length:240 start_codon:yes stop_codon:yes gene_type:complete